MNQKIMNYRNRIQSTYVTIAVIGVIIISAVVGLSLKNYMNFRDSLIEREQMQMLTLAESIARTLSDFVANKEEDVKILNRLISDQIHEKGLTEYLDQIIRPSLRNYMDVQKGDIYVAEWLSPDGTLLERFEQEDGPKLNSFQLHKAPIPSEFETTYTSHTIQDQDGKMYLDILEPVKLNGQSFGVIRFVISLEHLYEEYVKDVRAGVKGYASLKDSDGILIMHPTNEDLGQDVMVARKSAYPDYDWSDLEALVEVQKRGEAGVGIYYSVWSHDEDKSRVRKFNGFYPAKVGDDFWVVNVSMDYRELIDIVNKHLYTSMVTVGAVPLLFIIMSIYVLNLKRNLDQLQIEHNYVERLNRLNKELEEDIEQRKLLENELKQSRRRFRTLFNVGVDLTFVVKKTDTEQLMITDVNDSACQRLGIKRSALKDHIFFELDKKLSTEEQRLLTEEMYKNRTIQFETVLCCEDKSDLPVEINGRLFEFQDQVYGMLIARDITDRIQQMEEVERHRAMAIYKNRMAAVGEMVANIAHQWRQPLSSLNLMVSNLEDAYKIEELDADYFNGQINKAQNLIQKMSVIIDEFRYFFKPKEKEELFFIQDVIKQVQDMLYDRLNIECVDFSAKSEVVDIQIMGYSNQLSQVLLNLVGNALDAFSNYLDMENKWIKVNTHVHDKALVIQVYDNAGGIDDEKLSKLFEPYFTTKAEYGGTGIGLYMSRMIIESKFSGEISVKQGEDGLVFTIKIPLNKSV